MKHIVCFHVYNDYSGSPKVLQMVLNGLLQKGHTVDLITSRGCEGALDPLDDMPGFRKSTYYYKFNDRNLFLLFLNYLWAQVYMFFYTLKYAFRKDMVIYVNTIMPCGAAIAGRLIGKRVVCHYHENAFAKGPHYKINAWIMSHLAHEIVCVSAYQASFLKRKAGVTVVPNALPDEFVRKLRPDAEAAFNRKNILMLSSLKGYKGTKEFIVLASELPQYRFTLVINDEQKNIDRYLAENKISVPENIAIYPRQADVAPFYNDASIVLNLTDKNKAIETFGMTTLESMSAGLPVIVPVAGGIAELVDGQNGYRIDVRDLPRIEETINRMLSDKSLYSKLSENALAKSKEYNLDAMISKMECILNDTARRDSENLFFELVRVSLGLCGCLSRTPTSEEWKSLFSTANKQSLVGICFAGFRNPSASTESASGQRQKPPRRIFLYWVGMAAKIQQKNEEHRQLVKKISELLNEKGYRAIFMKGLTCAARYPEPTLRQPGDIDFVVREDDFKGVMKALEEIADVDHDLLHEHHGLARIGSVLLEPHYKIHNYQNPRNDRMMRSLQERLLNDKEHCLIQIGDTRIEKFPLEFEGMFLVSHMVNHVFEEGLGLRQILDYGMWIMDLPNHKNFDMELYHEYLRKMHMTRAAKIFTCICEKCFGIDRHILGYAYINKERKFAERLTADIMAVGNFARGAKERPKAGWSAYKWTVKRAWRLGYLCPSEARWWPVSKFVRFFDKKLNNSKYKH